MVLAWHFTADTLRDGRAIPPVGETLHHDGKLVICKRGLHASERILEALQYAPGPTIHRVRCGGEIVRQADKLCCAERTILWSHTISDKLLRDFARAQARSVLHLWDAPQIARDYLETGDETLRAAAWAAALAAVAKDAAKDAARAAARAAVAKAAAWAAAAWAAALAAVAKDAAWAAALAAVAKDAAKDAARAAARAAAWAAASEEFERLVLSEANQELESV